MSDTSTSPLRLKAVAEDNSHHENVAAFVSKLWDMLSKSEYDQLITWSEVSSIYSC